MQAVVLFAPYDALCSGPCGGDMAYCAARQDEGDPICVSR